MFAGLDLHTPEDVPLSWRDDWRRLLRDQHGLVSTDQALRYGISRHAIVANVVARRWQRVLHGVCATFTGELPRPARIMAAVLYAGDPVLVSHRTAAEEWGMVGVNDDEPIHVTVPYGCSAVSRRGLVTVHRSRAFKHIAAVGSVPPRTSRAATMIDLAISEPTWPQARRRFVALVAGIRVPLHEIAEQLQDRPPRRYRTALADGLRLVTDGVQSALEERYATDVEARHSLPQAARQSPVEVDGRTLYEDCTYDHLGHRLTVRLDGRQFHSDARVAFRDRRRDNAAELAGRSRLVYGWHDVAGDPCGVASEVVAVLRRLGWRGRPSRCGRCS